MKRVLFVRHIRAFQGGHLKVWDYFNHLRHAPDYQPRIYFDPRSCWDHRNPWLTLRNTEYVRETWDPDSADLLFLAGRDWKRLQPSERDHPPAPIVNLIQGIRHGDETGQRFEYLRHRAVRICVSTEIQTTLEETGQVNGPLLTIPNTIDAGGFPVPLPWSHRTLDVLIVAIKRPELGQQVAERLSQPGRTIRLVAVPVPRTEFLALMSQARVSVFLPLDEEGAPLPPLEGMALETIVVAPDCIGNRSYCRPGWNSYRPAYRIEDVCVDVEAALRLSADERQRLQGNAHATLQERQVGGERRRFLEILDTVLAEAA